MHDMLLGIFLHGGAHTYTKNLAWPPTLQVRSVGFYLCMFMQTQFQLGSHFHACTNETHCLANLQDLIPTLANIIMYRQHKVVQPIAHES